VSPAALLSHAREFASLLDHGAELCDHDKDDEGGDALEDESCDDVGDGCRVTAEGTGSAAPPTTRWFRPARWAAALICTDTK
jgi:hypothetical protein